MVVIEGHAAVASRANSIRLSLCARCGQPRRHSSGKVVGVSSTRPNPGAERRTLSWGESQASASDLETVDYGLPPCQAGAQLRDHSLAVGCRWRRWPGSSREAQARSVNRSGGGPGQLLAPIGERRAGAQLGECDLAADCRCRQTSASVLQLLSSSWKPSPTSRSKYIHVSMEFSSCAAPQPRCRRQRL